MTAHLRQLRIATAILTALLGLAASATGNPTGNTMTGIFDPDFRTLTIAVDGNRLAPPVITLGSSDRLVIGFDALRDDRDYLRYSIYHCDADWRISDLIDNEVFDGFNYADVTDYAFSRGTVTHYVHYTITLPNSEFSFRISGNYLLQVYNEDNPDTILLQARFMVSEGAVGVSGRVTSRTDVDYNASHQQLEFDVDLNRFTVRNPFTDLKVAVTQNGRADNGVIVTHPSRVSGNSVIYEHLRDLIFPAGNEYRRMETVQMTYPGMGVETIEYHAPYYHHLLSVDTPRAARNYSYDSTQHGRFFIREYNSTESDTEADYSVVHFLLDKQFVPDMDIYLDGDFTGRHFDESSRMLYDSEAAVYHKEMLLKQGAYNYQYLALPSGHGSRQPSGQSATSSSNHPRPFANGINTPALTSVVEGDFYQTVNEYLVAVYYRAPGDRYDRLLGYTLLFSGQ